MPITHIVRQGDCLSRIAKMYGFQQWQTIYGAPDNAEFRKRRPNPSILFPGDRIVIPDKQRKTVPIATATTNRFRMKSPKWVFRIEMKDEEMNPLSSMPFELYVDGKLLKQGATGSGGDIEVPIPSDANTGELHFMGENFQLEFGVLDPISRITGVQARLNNLGFNVGPVDGMLGPMTRNAVFAFQASQKDLQPSGEIDDGTRKRLLELHDNDQYLLPPEEAMNSSSHQEESLDETPEESSEDEWDDNSPDPPQEAWTEAQNSYEDF